MGKPDIKFFIKVWIAIVVLCTLQVLCLTALSAFIVDYFQLSNLYESFVIIVIAIILWPISYLVFQALLNKFSKTHKKELLERLGK